MVLSLEDDYNNVVFFSMSFYYLASWDVAEPWQMNFQDGATKFMFNIHTIHDEGMFYLVLIFTFVSWFFFHSLYEFSSKRHLISHLGLVQGSLVEFWWTTFPILILLLIAVPAFKLLYLTDEVPNSEVNVEIVGRQWFWQYEVEDLVPVSASDCGVQNINFDGIMLTSGDFTSGRWRLLETENILVLPNFVNVQISVTSADVIHCWTVPSLGINVDAIPGSFNTLVFQLNSEGLFYGQCSEICGANHSFMPISVLSNDYQTYLWWFSGLAGREF